VNEHVRVAVVGGGPAGLTAAATLAPRVDGPVLVLEREVGTGGVPRHSDHLGYGVRDLHRFISGPEYGRRLTARASAAGARLETEATVTGWAGDLALEVTSPRGRRTVTADAVILATGARERPRSARLIPGDRPDGVYTTGQLQHLVHLDHRSIGSRAVVIGAELVSWSAVLTLREGGCRTVLMTSEFPKPEAYAAFHLPGRFALGVALRTRTRVVAIHGGTGSPRSTSRTCVPAGAPASPATPSSPPATGSPTTSWPGRAASRSTRPRSGRASTPRWPPAGPVCSPRGTSCTRSTPPTWPPSTAGTSPPRSSPTSPEPHHRPAPASNSASNSSPTRPCNGWRRK
jgi:thioredoxin reductase